MKKIDHFISIAGMKTPGGLQNGRILLWTEKEEKDSIACDAELNKGGIEADKGLCFDCYSESQD